MTVYAVTYDLHNPGQNYEDVDSLLKSLGGYMKHFDSFWLISTSDYSASDIRNELNKVIDDNDKTLVLTITKGWASHNLEKDGVDWIKKHL